MDPFPPESDILGLPDLCKASTEVLTHVQTERFAHLRHVCSKALLIARTSFQAAKDFCAQALNDWPADDAVSRQILEKQSRLYEAFEAGDFRGAFESEATREETYLSLVAQVFKAPENSEEETRAFSRIEAFCSTQISLRRQGQTCSIKQGFATIKTAGRLVPLADEKNRAHLTSLALTLMSALTTSFSDSLCKDRKNADQANRTIDTALIFLAGFVDPYTAPKSVERKSLINAMGLLFSKRTAPSQSARALDISLNTVLEKLDERQEAAQVRVLEEMVNLNRLVQDPSQGLKRMRDLFRKARRALSYVFS